MYTFFLNEDMFSEHETRIFAGQDIEVSTFVYASGVAGLRITNSRGYIVVLPYCGQQIWDAVFDGVAIKMRGMLKEPRNMRGYLESFGAFFVHCGFAHMGVPGPTDHHELHGELHHAQMQSAFISAGRDERGEFVEVGGEFRHTIAFNFDCTEAPTLRLYAQEAMVCATLKVTNHKRSAMEYMYMAHPNFRYVENGRFVYTAQPTPENVMIRTFVPGHMQAPEENLRFMHELAKNPALHHVLSPRLPYDPEIVMAIVCNSDENGWAHSMLALPDGGAWYVKHRTADFPLTNRWICNTPDQQALGLSMPATAGTEGYTSEKALGRIKALEPGETKTFSLEMGMLTKLETDAMESKIGVINAGK